jgi:hypothetical protein
VPTLEATTSAQVPPAVLATATSPPLVVTSSTTLTILLVSALRVRLVLTRVAMSMVVELPLVLDMATSPPATPLMRLPARKAVCYRLLIFCDELYADMLFADSTAGKLMSKLGGMMKNEKMVEKGEAKREAAGAYGNERSDY